MDITMKLTGKDVKEILTEYFDLGKNAVVEIRAGKKDGEEFPIVIKEKNAEDRIDEVEIIKERIGEAFRRVAGEVMKHTYCGGECEGCAKTPDDECTGRVTFADGLASAAEIFADTLGIERLDF